MSRGQEVVMGFLVIIGGIIVYPWVVENIWNGFLATEILPAIPDNAWGDAFMAGFPIGLLIVIIAFGCLLVLGKVPGGTRRDQER